jgi:hypothetical protein
MMVSPYLQRPVRSLDEVLGASPAEERVEEVIRRVLAEAEAARQAPHDQISRAVAAVQRLRPGMTTREILALVRRLRGRV